MILKVALTIALSQYVRSRVDEKDPASQCLWWLEDTSIVLHQEVNGNPETGGTEFTAIGKSIATWQSKLNSCANLSLTEGARTRTRNVGFFSSLKTDTKNDNENVMVFRLRKCADVVPAGDSCLGEADDCGNKYDCWQHQSGAIAITTTSYDPESGQILDSDVEYNMPFFLFTTVDAPVCPATAPSLNCVVTDVENTTTHELGHLLGLSHFSSASSTMNARANTGELIKRTLDTGTAQFVCDAYPKGKPSKTCLIRPVSSTLGEVARGCSAAPGLLPLALLGLLRRRRKA